MFAEKFELKLVDDASENALVELNPADVEDVSGAAIPLIVWGAIAIASGGAAGVGLGYLVNR
ncbi:hypothetical protein [Paracoccus sp. S3-43]|uniref:hypothetical protein n=1 Tax=Paracoccus sp. S3-43 TaxID=3030011 RepID=UPI0023B1C226|nr:hypothetical protein [Paracoccus sp. S3-43]WEF25817.1 hypothetical protein PXD02_07890 [Paracoccus sp. S3-43]